jgi:arylsulfatase
LTGKHAGHAYIRGNDEWKSRGDVWNYKAMYDDPGLEGQRPLPEEELTFAEVLQQAGYTTACIGKWGLGAPNTEGTAIKQGFDYFYGYNCQRQAHTLYPGHLYENEDRVYLDNPLIAPHTPLPDDADTTDVSFYAAYDLNEYAPELMGAKAIEFIKREKENPFFMLFASPLPHVPLQAPQKWITYYEDKFEETLPYQGKPYFPSFKPRATYAAMISYLDEQVGMIVSTLEELGLAQNTLIIFTSDNGPTYTGGADTEFFNSAAPFRTDYGRGKGFLYEGGIRVPMIASWPGVIESGSASQHISAAYDWANTFVDIAGASKQSEFEDGISMCPVLTGASNTQQKHDFLYFEQPEYHGQQAVRYGKWKGIVTKLKDGNTHIELYDLDSDPTESADISAEHSDIVAQIESIMRAEHTKPEIELFYLPEDTSKGQ